MSEPTLLVHPGPAGALPEAAVAINPMHRAGAQSDRPPHVLAINNDQDMLAIFRDLLEGDAVHRVTTRVYANHDVADIAAVAPDLIVLDYMWAGEDGGWTLLHMLRAHPATSMVPIVLCTGAVRPVEELGDHLAAMAVRVVLKPFRISQLVAAIEAGLAPGRKLAS
jgi:CheY-like chemotaxis protein